MPVEEKGKVKECCEVGEGHDTITIEDTSNDEDGETLQERFQLRSRFSRPGLPNVPLIIEKPASLEASIPVPQGGRAMWCGTRHQEVEDHRDN
jgi:hypothetical protein